MKALYWLRKLMGFVLVAAWMVLYLVLFLNGKTKYSTLLIIILLVIVLISMSIYPRSSEYCSCGHRWYKKYTFKETTSSSKTNKKGITKETFVHVFNCNCVCNNCKKVKIMKLKLMVVIILQPLMESMKVTALNKIFICKTKTF